MGRSESSASRYAVCEDADTADLNAEGEGRLRVGLACCRQATEMLRNGSQLQVGSLWTQRPKSYVVDTEAAGESERAHTSERASEQALSTTSDGKTSDLIVVCGPGRVSLLLLSYRAKVLAWRLCTENAMKNGIVIVHKPECRPVVGAGASVAACVRVVVVVLLSGAVPHLNKHWKSRRGQSHRYH